MKKNSMQQIEKNIDKAFEKKDIIYVSVIVTSASIDFNKRELLKYQKMNPDYTNTPVITRKVYSTEDGNFLHEKNTTIGETILEISKIIDRSNSEYSVEARLLCEEKNFDEIFWIKDPKEYNIFLKENEHKHYAYSKRIGFPGFERYNNGMQFMLDSQINTEIKYKCIRLFSDS